MDQQQPVKPSSLEEFSKIITNLTHVDKYSDFQSLLKKAAKQVTTSDATSLILRHEEECCYLDEESDRPLWKGMCFPLRSCVSGWSILNAQTVAIENIFMDERVPAALYLDKNIQSLLVVPIDHGEVIGAISAYWNKRHTPSKSEISQLEALASVSSLVFESMKTKSELEEIIEQRTFELKIANQQLESLAIHDELTGLYNRRGLFLMADQIIKASDRSSMRCALIFADLDDLKTVNDTYGHQAGDKLIKLVADVLNSHFRKTDIVARIGGDEFCIMIIDPDENQDSLKYRLQAEFDKINDIFDLPHQVLLSLGCVISKLTPATKLESLLSKADKLMYLDKSRKKRRTK